MLKVMCLGVMVADIIAKPVNEIPEEGKLTVVNTIDLYTGGCAGNTALDLKILGGNVGITGLVGDDGMGDFLINHLKNKEIDVRGLRKTSEGSTSISMVLSNSKGERSFIHSFGANGLFCEKYIDYEIIKDYDIVFVGGEFLMPKFDGKDTMIFLKKAKELGKYTILDTAWNEKSGWMNTLAKSLKYLDLFIPSYEEAKRLSGTSNEKIMAKIFMDKGVKTVVIKMGEKGCYIKNKDEEHYIKPFNVNAVDTNGAGDSFVAGFITGLINNWSLKKCGIFANAVGANCVMNIGASSGIKHKNDIIKFVKESGIKFD